MAPPPPFIADPTYKETASFPVVQRTGIRFFRKVTHVWSGIFGAFGTRVLFAGETLRALVAEPKTYMPEVAKHMRTIGVDSLPLTTMVAAFIGAVIALQTRYQLFPGIQLSVVGFITRQMIILEMAPLLTGLVLAGRVGARIAAEIGTMRVTEQIDALETLAFDPIAYLVVPRVIAGFVMLPILSIFASAVGLSTAMLTSRFATDVSTDMFLEGLRLGYDSFQIIYSLIKAFMFGGAISFLCAFEGYVITGSGAEGVGRSTAKAVVVASAAILILDALTAMLLAPYLQG